MTDASTVLSGAAGADAEGFFGPIERIGGIGPDEFVRRYRNPRKPVILTDAQKGWTANGRFTPEYFISEYGDLPIRVADRDYTLGEAIRLLQQATPECPGPYPTAIKDCRAFVADIMPRPAFALPNRHTHPLVTEKVFSGINHLDIFFGGPGNNFPFPHYDYLHMHGWVAQVYGDKEMTLYEPGQEDVLYVDPKRPWRSEMENSGKPDFQRYPLFAKARSQKVVVHAGETLFIPCGTWHTAHCLNLGISVLFDQLEPSNWREFTKEVVAFRQRAGHPGKAMLFGAYLWLLGPLMSLAERFGANRRADWGLG